MNKIYRLVWNKSLNLWTVVSENARGVTKKRNVAANISIKTEASLSSEQYQHVLLKPNLIAIALSSIFFGSTALAAVNTGGGSSNNGSSMAISPTAAQCGTGGEATVSGGNGTAVGCGNNISGTNASFQQTMVNRRGTGSVAYGSGVPTGSQGGVLSSATAVGRQNTIRGAGGATIVGNANNSNTSAGFTNVLMGQGNSTVGTGGFNTLMGIGNQVVDDPAGTPDGTGIGTNSIAIGVANRVTGQTAIAFGRQSYADADYSIAQGNTATVNKGATGGIALGYSATTSGQRGIAIGSSDSTTRDYDLASSPHAAGVDSIAMGTRSKATGNETIAVGRQSTATNTRDIAVGQGATAQGVTENGVIYTATAVGHNARATNKNTIALGEQAVASGSTASAVGAAARAENTASTAMGAFSKATANFATATGNFAEASGVGATVTGSNAKASGETASAFGALANASGAEATAIGAGAQASSDFTVALGAESQARSNGDIAVGFNAGTAAGTTGDNIAMGNGITTGATGKNVAIGSDGTTANSETTDGGAVAIGRDQVANGDGAVAIGDPNRASGSGAVALGKDNTAAGDTAATSMANGAVAIGNTNQAIGQGSVAIGNTSVAAAAGGIALGDTANAQAERGVALGSNAVATNADDVALGSGSVTSAANPTANGTVGGVNYNYAGTTPSSVVSVGSEGNERQITNVAAGRVSETSTDAINGSQLYSTQQALGNLVESTANHLGGGSVVNPDGSVTAPSYTVNGVESNNVGDAITALDKGWNLQSNGAKAGAIKATDTVDIGTVEGEENLTVTKDGNTIQYGLNKDLKVDSVTAGDTVINDNGVTITNGPSITKSGINAAGNPITNVGAGVNDTDAVNKGQLDKVAAASKTEVTQGKNITVSKTTGADGQDIYNVATANDVSFDSVQVGDVNIDGTTGKISGVTAGEVSATSDEAINGSQLAGTAKSVSDALGGGSVVNPDGTVTAPSYTVNGVESNNVGDAITELDKGWNLQSNGAGNTAIKAGDTVDIGTKVGEENLTVEKNGNTIQYGLNKDLKVDSVTAGDTVINSDGVTIANGPSITKSGINAAGNPITNVGAGVNDTDAVNKGQLDKAAAASKTEVTQGKNITVSKTTGADGQDIYNVATADDVSFDSVQVGDVNIDGTTGKISGVTAGEVSATSDEAINGSQLAGTAKSVSDALGGGSVVNPDGTVTAPSYTVNGVESNNVGDAITELDKGWNLQSNGAGNTAIKAGDTVDIGTKVGEENLTVEKNGNTIQYGLNKDLKVDSVTAGDTVINSDGVTIANGPSITKSGINAAGNPITNVGAGVNGTDAVNKDQLDDAAAASKTEVTEGKNITVSKTVGADGQDIYEVATADDVSFDSVQVGDVNIDGTTGKISGVTAGEVSATSDEAINGSQLAGTAKSVSDALGGGSVVNPDGTVTAPSYTVNGVESNNVGDAIEALDQGWNLQSNGANADAIKAGDTVDIGTVDGEDNLTVTKDGNTIQYGLNKDLKVDSVTAGDTVINTDGVTISNGPSITKSGINAAGNPITNVGAGVNDTDAVNKGQLDDAAAAAKTEVTEGKNITVTKTTGADGQDIYEVATADDVSFDSVQVGDVNIDGITGKISGVTAGEVSATSDEAINGSQLAGTAKSVSDALGGGSVVNPDGTVTAPSYTVNGVESNNVGDAIGELDKGWNLQSNGANAGAIKATDTVDIGTVEGEENLTVTKDGNTIQYGLNKDLKVDSVTAGDTVINDNGVTIANGPSITKSGINAAGNPITNVGAGVNGTDAVNKDQLDDAAAASKTEVTEGKNITVTKTTGANGQDIYEVATARDVDFDSVQVGDVNIDGATGKISGVTDGTIAAGSKDAVNGGQLNDSMTSTGDILGGGVTNEGGKLNGPFTVNDKGYDTVADAIQGETAAAKTEVTEGKNITVSKTVGADGQDIYNVATADDVSFDSVQVGDVNIDGATGKISGVADGTIAAGSKDAVNGGQLNDSMTSTGDILGGGVTNEGGKLNGPFTVNDKGYDTVADAIQGETAASKTEVTEGKNITVSKTVGADGQDIYEVATADDVSFDSVQVGDVNIDGATGKISGVADGTIAAGSKDAVNGGQLNDSMTSTGDILGGGVTNEGGKLNGPFTVNDKGYDTVADAIQGETAAAKTEVTEGKNITVSKTVGADGQDIYEVATARDVDFDSVQVGDVNIDGTTGKISGVADGTIAAGSKDAVNGGQIHGIADSVKNSIGGETTLNPDGSITTSNVGNTGKGNIHDAIDSVRGQAVAAKTTVTEGDNMVVTQTKNADGSTNYEVATARDVDFDSVQVGDVNIDGTTGKISGVADGTIAAGSKDAVNGGQLNDSMTSTGDILGGGVTNEGGKLNGPFTVNDKGYDTVADAIQGETAAAKTEVTEGKNITVSKTTGADGQDIYEVATARDVDFDSVQVGDVNIDGATGKISGVTDGTIAAGSKDAVNGGQIHGIADSVKNSIGGETTLNPDGSITTSNVGNTGKGNIHDAIDSVRGQAVAAKTTVTEGDNMVVTQTKNADGSTNYEVATARDVDFDSVQVGDVNIDGATGKISGVTDGTIAAGSKDAVNGGQLNDSMTSTGDILGGGVTNEGGKLNGPFTVNDKGYDTVADAIQGETAAAKTEVTEGKNITVSKTVGADGQDIYEVATADDVSFDSVQVGDVNIDGATGKISGVTDGMIAAGSKDAVNGGQLNDSMTSTGDILGGGVTNEGGKLNGPFTVNDKGYDTVADAIQGETAAAKTEVEAGKNMTVESRTGADGQTIYEVATADDVSFDSVQVGDVNIDGATGKISGVADGTIAAGSKDAVNGGQIHGIADSVKNSIGGETTLNPDGSITTSNVGNTGKGNIHDAIDSVRGQAVAAKTEVEAGKNMTVESRTGADGQTIYEVATADDVSFDSVQVGDVNIDGATGKISGVTDGTIAAGSKDAVNGGQLNDSMTSTGDILGGGVTNEGGKLNGPFTVNDKGYDTVADAIQGETAAAKTEVTEGKNITVSKTVGADGQDIYEVATADDVSFDSVQVGDVNIDGTTGKISGVTDGTIAAGSKDAVNGGQIHGIADSVKNSIGGETTLNPDGSITTSNVGNTGKGNIHDAIDSVRGQAVAAKTTVTEGGNMVVTQTKNADGSTNYEVATAKDVKFDSVTATDAEGNETILNAEGVSLKDQAGNTTILGPDGLGFVDPMGNSVGPRISARGIDAGNTVITGVAPGRVAGDSTDAINGSQLKGVADSVKNIIGGNTVVNPDGTIKGGNIGGTGKDNINDAIGAIGKAAQEAKTTVSKAEGDENVTVTSRPNAEGGTDFEVGLSKDIKVDSVTAGDTRLDGDGLTIAGGPSVTKDGIDAGDKKVTGVADGTVAEGSKDAINGGQLHGVADSVKNIIGGNTTVNPDGTIAGDNIGGTGKDNINDAIGAVGKAAKEAKTTVSNKDQNITVKESKNKDGGTDFEVGLADKIKVKEVTADQVNAGQINVAGDQGSTTITGGGVSISGPKGEQGPSMTTDGINAGGKKVTGVADGAIASGSKDGINGGQLHRSYEDVGAALGGGAGYDPSTGWKGPSYDVAGGKYDNVGDALGAIDNRVTNLGDQLQQAFYDTNKRMDKLEDKMSAGIAATAALENAPFVPGKLTMAAGAAYYNDQSAIGVTFRKTADNGRWSLTTGAAMGSQGNSPLVRVGVSTIID